MSTPPSDDELWQAFVEATREAHRCQADFYNRARDRPGILRAALPAGAGPWQRGAALDFLTGLSDDVPALLDDLVDLALSPGWALATRRAIGTIPHDDLVPLLEPLVLEHLETANEDDYRRLTELLVHVEAWDLLGRLVAHGLEADAPDTREAADDLMESYGPMWRSDPT
ncbi:hypothetical protein DFP74_4656 [Nocardiopsis sp. Huas11]|uniref:hypothetical protein n=1 Tax=Nocardiopsis sp. Huas11 TaxID=2183912 RepID=UPI000EB2B105|nr:hypothetical protein [Nocardiopsis sp. Huas11]RKS08930.1 hypothetical protein DFP74_4656 [Nocardiopsis sp. Huas11]